MQTRPRPKPSEKQALTFTVECPGRAVFNHITSRWGLLLLITLGEEPLRFHQLRDRLEGMAEKMLSQNLKLLVRDGLVRRLVEPTIPPRVTYELTSLGRDLTAPLRELVDRLGRRIPDVLAAQQAYDRQP